MSDPHFSGHGNPSREKRRILRGWRIGLLVLLVLVGAFVALVGPWPTMARARPGYWEDATVRALAAGRQLNNLPSPAPLQAGWAVHPFDLPPGVSLAGYLNRPSLAAKDAEKESLSARALALQAGRDGVIILMADLVLVNETLANEVRHRVRQALAHDLQPLVLFTATHTHSGPGGWGRKFVERWSVAGRFDPQVYSTILESLVGAALDAWNSRGPAAMAILHTEAPDLLRNRSVSGGALDARLEALWVRRMDSGEEGMVVLFGGHATTLGSAPAPPSRDYPGVLVDTLENKFGLAFAGFAAGCVGSQSTVTKGCGKEIGSELAARVEALRSSAALEDHVRLRTVRFEIPQPEIQIRLGPSLRFSPFLSSYLRDGPVGFDALRVDNWVWVALPLEPSGMLSGPWRTRAKADGIALTLTPFNGYYLGYLLPDEFYEDTRIYEAQMSFLGPQVGHAFGAILQALLEVPE